MAYAYTAIGLLLILWGASQLRRGLKPFRIRPFLLMILGAVMIYSAAQQGF